MNKTPSLRSETPVARCFVGSDNVTEYQTAYLDGYAFGDRLLENVIFKYTLDEHGHLIVEPHEPNRRYLKQLNMIYWLDIALNYGVSNDIFSSNPEIDGNGDELIFQPL